MANDIRGLCDRWSQCILKGTGVAVFNDDTENLRLYRQNIFPHELSYNELIDLIIGLSGVAYFKKNVQGISYDHFFCWAWCADIVTRYGTNFYPIEEIEIENLFKATYHASIANCEVNNGDSDEFQRRGDALRAIGVNKRNYMQTSMLSLCYLVFPLLESTLKKLCSEYVGLDGVLKKNVKYTDANGIVINKVLNANGKPKIISSLKELIYIYKEVVIDAEGKKNIEDILGVIAERHADDPCDVIYKWRNSSLHGTENFMQVGGLLLCLTSLLIIYDLKDRYDSLKENVLNRLVSTGLLTEGGDDSFREFYPPCNIDKLPKNGVALFSLYSR
ncbi:hypothetical protein [Klebsiella pneumoniae]|uniref:hypothetical protein n=1 Tax=Klebsiella pneumoniae TaxID=573 RepID=UPI001CA51E41|nr:hypothetical protein [Klebsiella pneumoniae]MBW5763599.1 hypothetical protein [Klebsiella pneumoniae]